MPRDYRGDFWAYIEANPPTDPYTLPEAALQIVADLERDDLDLLVGWLKTQAVRLVYGALDKRDRDGRLAARLPNLASYFRRVEGDLSDKGLFEAVYVVSEGVRKKLGDMTGPDHLFVAKQREVQGKTLLFHAAFHRAVAKKIPEGKTTKEVLTEYEYVAMMQPAD